MTINSTQIVKDYSHSSLILWILKGKFHAQAESLKCGFEVLVHEYVQNGVFQEPWLYEPPLWPWTWRQKTNLPAWPMMMHHHTKFGYKRFCSWGDIIRWTVTGIVNLFCDLDLDHNKAIQSFHKTIQLLMMCRQTKINNSEEILEIIFWLYDPSL